MRFLVDAQLPPALAKHLEAAGHDAQHVNRIGLGSAPDRDVWSHARSTGSVLITKDVDFIALSRPGADAPGIIWVRVGNVTNAALMNAFERTLPDLLSALDAGERLVEIR